MYLNEALKASFRFEDAARVLAALEAGDFASVKGLPRSSDKGWETSLVLWFAEGARTAFLEAEASFSATSKPVKKMTLEKDEQTAARWLIYSRRLDAGQAEYVLRQLGAPAA